MAYFSGQTNDEFWGMIILEALSIVNKLVIRAAPEPKPCYICRAQKDGCKRYSIPSIYWLTDVYAITGSLELLKNITVFWLCEEHHAWFDDVDKHYHLRDLEKPLTVYKNEDTGETHIRMYENPCGKTTFSPKTDIELMTDGEGQRFLEIWELIKSSHKIISNAFNVDRPDLKFYIEEDGV